MSLAIALVMVTPGPTNTLLLVSGIQLGLRRAWHLVIFSILGYCIAITLLGGLMRWLSQNHDWVYSLLKLVCAAWIIYLAITLWKKHALHGEQRGPINARNIFMVTLVNPKSLLFAGSIFPPEAFGSLPVYGVTMLFFCAIVLTIGTGWIALGSVMTLRRSWQAQSSIVMRATAVVLLLFSGTLALSVVRPLL
jgi:threonine/homoserine/homoserine lactone efflux protein